MAAQGASDTIYALASGTGRVAVSVLRVSGDQAFRALECLQGRLQPHAQLLPRLLKNPSTHETLDRAMTVRFCAPKSYTGEDMAEIHFHGSRAVLEAVLAAWRANPQLKLRQAERGEFSRRALVAGKISLTQAEGLVDLISAETQAQRRQALTQSEGALARLYGGWEERVFLLLCRCEAHIDFADEDLPRSEREQDATLRSLVEEIEAHLALGEKAARVRTGLSVAITGAPNVGKSSLLNRIAASEVAIVAATPGTTRDVLRVRTEIASLSVDLLDTAGLRRAEDAVEAEGIRRARISAEQADLVVRVEEAGMEKAGEDAGGKAEVAKGGDDAGRSEGRCGERTRADMVLFNKGDLLDEASRCAFSLPAGAFLVSARTGKGIGDFLEALGKMLEDRVAVSSESSLAPTRERHGEALREAVAGLRRALAEGENRGDWGLMAEALRGAHGALGRLVGRRNVEALLDRIFAEFCIGK